MAENILDKFRPEVGQWFTEVFAAPTDVQAGAWKAISAGDHALVVAPTGSGKTLAAFLWALNNLVGRHGQTALPVAKHAARESSHGGVKVLYISPLKALGVDVEQNLRAPLAGISRVAQRLGVPEPEISVGVALAAGLHCSRLDGSPITFNNEDTYIPDLLVCRPELADDILAHAAEFKAAHGGTLE